MVLASLGMRRRPCEPPCAPVFFVSNGATVLLTLTSGSGVTFEVLHPCNIFLGVGVQRAGYLFFVFPVVRGKSLIISVMKCAVKLRVSGILFYCCYPDS
jgi:hypothetical protein